MGHLKILLLLSVVLCHGASSAPVQRFDRQPQYTEVNPGEDAKLSCTVHHKKGHCSWQKDGKPVGMYPKKYEWAAGGAAMGPGGPMPPPGGDCSIWIRSATIEFDDGEWECQVTASDFASQDALTSNPVKLVVRVAPQRPRIEYNATQMAPGQNVSAKSGERASLRCISRYGNPPAKLKWKLGDEPLSDTGNQTSVREQDNPKTWSTSSVLDLAVVKRHHGRNLRCVAVHDLYPEKSLDVDVKLDVRYPPEVRLVGAPSKDVEEGRDAVELKCESDANPPATVSWRRSQRAEMLSVEPTLTLRPVRRSDTGTYTCQARNVVGASQPLSVHIDVKYPPRILHVGPDRKVTASLFSQTSFACEAEGNPPPSIQWLQKLPIHPMAIADGSAEEKVILRGAEPRLVLTNLTYDHQGEYVCRAANKIANVERPIQSEPIPVHVKGAPQVVRRPNTEIYAARGHDAIIRMVVCADPRPRRISWEWGSMQLEAGMIMGRYKADELTQDVREDCYEARFHMKGADAADARSYTLTAENERGSDRHTVLLAVRDPVSMIAMIGILAAGMIILLITACVLICAYRKETCCFKPEPINSLIDGIYVKPTGVTASGRNDTQPTSGELNRAWCYLSPNSSVACIAPGDARSEKSPGGPLTQSRRSSHDSNGALASPPIYTTSPPRGGPRMMQGAVVTTATGAYHHTGISHPISSAEKALMRGANFPAQAFHSRSFGGSASTDTVFATLQVPRISNNGSTKVAVNRGVVHSIYRPLEYADI
ncbi:kin of IRRE-like protein 2 isoform X2 [Neocloeon triangulifer]|uniref:kin of IRRE-like protein 2 isoform X2 n=1 Tax=Neocloeon triangulifer TaxID=2078957 RepID=UPI00286F42E4|nr:kin of IRRE-like protein 2 isoform X2 [Neocloeon triangulifer]